MVPGGISRLLAAPTILRGDADGVEKSGDDDAAAADNDVVVEAEDVDVDVDSSDDEDCTGESAMV